MKNSTAKKILLVIEAILGLAALILILISMFGNLATNLPLTLGLACVAIAGILSVILQVMKSKEAKN